MTRRGRAMARVEGITGSTPSRPNAAGPGWHTGPRGTPEIDGYVVWWGRAWLHARHRGTFAQARTERRPWHVVAPSPGLLAEAVRRGW